MSSLMLVNPRKRRKSKKRASPAKRKSTARRALSVASKKVRRYRRNPIGGRKANVLETLKSGAVGAAGAVASEFVLSKLPLPDQLSSGPGLTAAKALVGVGVGMLVSKVSKNRGLGKNVAEGAVTIALHDTIRNAVGPSLGLPSTGLAFYDQSLISNNPFDNSGMSFYNVTPTYPNTQLSPNFFQ